MNAQDRKAILTIVIVVSFIALFVVGILAVTESSGDKSPIDWNPGATCVSHSGVRQVSMWDDVPTAVVCQDNSYFKNPYY